MISNSRGLNFGNIVPLTGGTVSIEAKEPGVRSASPGGVTLVPGLTSSAEFEVEGDGGSTYAITRTPLVGTLLTLTNIAPGAETMDVDIVVSTITDDGVESTTGLLSGSTGTNGTQKIYVGGTLTVANAQASGIYRNAAGIVISVDYN